MVTDADSPDSVAAEVEADDGEDRGGRSSRRRRKSVAEKPPLRRWEADYQLEQIDRLHLFDEYIEMGEQ